LKWTPRKTISLPEEYDRLCDRLVEAGTFFPLDDKKWPGCFYARSAPTDVARVEERTFICSLSKDNAGPTNNWEDPFEMRRDLKQLFPAACAAAPCTCFPSPWARSARPCRRSASSSPTRLRRRQHAHHGAHRRARLAEIDKDGIASSLHALRRRAARARAEGRPWPCNDLKYIVHFPETREIWSYGSGYGGNALLGKKCFALRIASNMARDEGWMAEHMLILGSPARGPTAAT
jgi:phosphoenolpyruvate carboxykinase (GTP)